MERSTAQAGIPIVVAPPAVSQFVDGLDDTIREQLADAVVYQSPAWISPSGVEIVQVARRTVNRGGIRGVAAVGTEMLLTVHVRQNFAPSNALPLYALVEHWEHGLSCGTAMQSMWAQSEHARVYVMRHGGPVITPDETVTARNSAYDFWAKLRIAAEKRDAPFVAVRAIER